ncbi:MAG: hypothetical protein DWQ05_07405 [Calditrichaeota bacterium]|nr:MAG: hypothetical protein DWQ05_07405 [Calditrichota bacterium]
MSHSFAKLSIFIVLLFFICTPSKLYSQDKKAVSVEWIYSNSSAELTAIPRYFWLANNTAMLFDLRKPANERNFEIFDPRTGNIAPAVDAGKAMGSLNTFFEEGRQHNVLRWPVFFDAWGRQAVYLFQNDIFILDLSSSKFSRVTETAAAEKSVQISPDGKLLSFVRENDLYVFNIKENKEIRLTTDGSETILNGTLSWVYWEEIFGRSDTGYWWSSDSKRLAYLQTDESPVEITHFVDFQPAVPRVIKQRYPKAGTANPKVRVGIANIQSAKTTWVDFAADDYEYIPRVKWLPDSKQLSVQTLNRAQDGLKLYFVNSDDGNSKFILRETDNAWVNLHDDLIFLNNGKHFIWQSERDGFAHLYRFTMDGTRVNQITRGDWAVKSAGRNPRQTVAAVDEKNDWIYFSALEKASIERHLYRIHSDGSKMERLTEGDGTHAISFSPDGKYYFDTFSNVRTQPSLSLNDSKGKSIKILSEPRPELVEALDFQYPEFFTIPTSDGFLMPAEILKPKDFNANKKYPVIMNIYGGPSAPTVANSWNRGHYFDQILIKKGYLVVRFDHRAAAGISKKFENLLLKKFIGPVELADIIDGVKWLKSQPWVDGDRFGIWGWSGGGSFTLHTMTRSKEFKAGISVAPVTDWHFYDTKWAEFAMKTPQENPEGYKNTSILRHAKNLHGRLLLVHGTYDDNVHPQNAWSFIEELVQANIPFDMMFYPMRKHGIADRAARIHLFNKMLEFWEENL